MVGHKDMVAPTLPSFGSLALGQASHHVRRTVQRLEKSCEWRPLVNSQQGLSNQVKARLLGGFRGWEGHPATSCSWVGIDNVLCDQAELLSGFYFMRLGCPLSLCDQVKSPSGLPACGRLQGCVQQSGRARSGCPLLGEAVGWAGL